MLGIQFENDCSSSYCGGGNAGAGELGAKQESSGAPLQQELQLVKQDTEGHGQPAQHESKTPGTPAKEWTN